jgi:hypothetical protein
MLRYGKYKLVTPIHNFKLTPKLEIACHFIRLYSSHSSKYLRKQTSTALLNAALKRNNNNKSDFERIVWQCAQAGLVDGSKLFMDSSLVQADASNNSVVNKESLKCYLNKSYKILESRLEQEQQCSGSDEKAKSGAANQKYISTTDPDASVTRRGKGKSKLKYQVHRSVDQKREVVTATEVTPW